MLVFVSVILSTTRWVKLKMESLSGFTDLVVSIKKVKGGFKTALADVEAETGQSLHLQATHLEQNEINFYRYYRSTYELGDFFFILKT